MPTARSPLGRVVARHPVAAFLVMAFVFSWTIMLPLLLSQSGFGVLPFALPWQVFGSLMSVFGLALPAFLVAAAKDGEDGVWDLLGRVFWWRVGAHWYLIALFGLLMITLLAAIPFLGVAPLGAFAENWSLIFTAFLPASSCPSCSSTCGRRPPGRGSCSTPSRRNVGPSWPASWPRRFSR